MQLLCAAPSVVWNWVCFQASYCALQHQLPLNAQEASSSYYLMRQRLLALYETSHICRYPALAAAL